MEQNYFSPLSSDIINAIVSYLSFEDLNNFIINYEHLINWKSAFIYKYFNKVYPNIDEFNIKNLYIGFTQAGRMAFVIKNNIDYNRYSAYNGIIYIDESDIALLDDIIVYEYLEDKLDDSMIIRIALNYDSLNLLEYILKKNNNNVDDLTTSVRAAYESGEVSIEATKLFLKYHPDAKADILLSTYTTAENFDIFKYLIDNYTFSKDILMEVLWLENRSDYAYVNVKLIIEKYYELIKDKLLEFYKLIIDRGIIVDDKYKIITYLASLDVIKKELL